MSESLCRREFVSVEVDSGAEAFFSIAWQGGLHGIFEYCAEKAGHVRMGTVMFGTLPGAAYGDTGALQSNEHTQFSYGTGVTAVAAQINGSTTDIELATSSDANGVTVTGWLRLWSD